MASYYVIIFKGPYFSIKTVDGTARRVPSIPARVVVRTLNYSPFLDACFRWVCVYHFQARGNHLSNFVSWVCPNLAGSSTWHHYHHHHISSYSTIQYNKGTQCFNTSMLQYIHTILIWGGMKMGKYDIREVREVSSRRVYLCKCVSVSI